MCQMPYVRCNVKQHAQFVTGAICNKWNLQQIQFSIYAICKTCNLQHSNLQHLQSATTSLCNMCNMQHIEFARHAIYNTCNLQHVQFASYKICSTCNFQNVHFASHAICNTCNWHHVQGKSARWISYIDQLNGYQLKGYHLDVPAGRISWTDQLDGSAGWTSSLYMKPWPVHIFKDWPFS